jgi:hypothetical protein
MFGKRVLGDGVMSFPTDSPTVFCPLASGSNGGQCRWNRTGGISRLDERVRPEPLADVTVERARWAGIGRITSDGWPRSGFLSLERLVNQQLALALEVFND